MKSKTNSQYHSDIGSGFRKAKAIMETPLDYDQEAQKSFSQWLDSHQDALEPSPATLLQPEPENDSGEATGTAMSLPTEEEECPHDEHDHGYCLECGKDILDDLVGQVDFSE
jgi:hypothetical protein